MIYEIYAYFSSILLLINIMLLRLTCVFNCLMIYMLELLFFLLYLFVNVIKGERQMNLSMWRSFLFDMDAYIKGEHIMLIDRFFCICISLRGVFLIHLIGVLSSSKRGRLLNPCLILMIPKHFCYDF